jgi:hypothetical protein
MCVRARVGKYDAMTRVPGALLAGGAGGAAGSKAGGNGGGVVVLDATHLLSVDGNVRLCVCACACDSCWSVQITSAGLAGQADTMT